MQKANHESECIGLRDEISKIQITLDKILECQMHNSVYENTESYIKNIVRTVLNELSSSQDTKCETFEDLLVQNVKLSISPKNKHLNFSKSTKSQQRYIK